jgi:hypothetical protein
MNKFLILGFLFGLLLLQSCQDDLDVLAEYKEIPVVYCMLNQADNVHYVKLNRAFLGETSASTMAQQTDSLFYEDAKVWVNVYKNGALFRRMDFVQVDTIPKPEGFFANDRNTLYVWQGNIEAINGTASLEYELNVEIPSKEIFCQSVEPIQLVDGAVITNPATNRQIALTHYDQEVDAEYRTGDNGSLYQMLFKFYYFEVNEETKDTNWNLPPIQITLNADEYSGAGAEIKKSLSVQQFYGLLQSNIPEKPGYQRFARFPETVEFELFVADEYYKIYSEVNSESNGIVQEKPFYNGNIGPFPAVGLFAARYQTVAVNRITEASLDSLSRGKYTKHLNFANKNHPYYLTK